MRVMATNGSAKLLSYSPFSPHPTPPPLPGLIKANEPALVQDPLHNTPKSLGEWERISRLPQRGVHVPLWRGKSIQYEHRLYGTELIRHGWPRRREIAWMCIISCFEELGMANYIAERLYPPMNRLEYSILGRGLESGQLRWLSECYSCSENGGNSVWANFGDERWHLAIEQHLYGCRSMDYLKNWVRCGEELTRF